MRLITRADFDGIVCGVLITAREAVDRFCFVEPKSMQDGEVPVGPEDIIANLPYQRNCLLWFDHHFTNKISTSFRGRFEIAPSAARVVFDHYPPGSLQQYAPLVEEADRIDSANLTVDDIVHPQHHVLLSFTIDPRDKTDEPYWVQLIHLLREKPFAEVMETPDIKDRCQRVLADFEVYRDLVVKKSRREGTVVVTDFRGEGFKGKENRFLVYCLYPEATTSIRVFNDARRQGRTGISIGKNIFNKSPVVNVGELLSHYGGGGHQGAGSCRVPEEEADRILAEIIHILNAPLESPLADR